MARKPGGRDLDLLAKAKKMLPNAKSAREVRQLQALLLPVEFGLSLKQTAMVTGVSVGWISQLRNSLIKNKCFFCEHPKRGGRYHHNLTPDEEVEFLAPFLEKTGKGGIYTVRDIKCALEKRLGRKVALASIYNLLHRHNWRKK